ncbi:tail fiber protein [Leptothoe sp. LEGE 181152]|nr:tail fiber protein [Leptothoe sp. LEGE 181152]
MAEPFIGEIRLFGGTYAIRGWAFCNGSTVSISQNQALFAVLGTTFGGDGRNTLGLPNLQGRAPVGMGQGPGLNRYNIGQHGGSATVTLTESNMPSHTHQAAAVEVPTAFGGSTTASNNILAQPDINIYGSATSPVDMASSSLSSVGSDSSSRVDNEQPYLSLNFLIALTGIFPSRG